MSGRPVVLQELGPSVPVAIDDAAAAAIGAAAAAWRETLRLKEPPLAVERGRGGWRLRAGGVAGIVAAGGVTIEIVPKFLARMPPEDAGWRRALWHILLVASDPQPARLERQPAEEAAAWSLPDLMATEFLCSLELGSMRGLPRGYEPAAATLPVLRGSLDFGAWARRGLPSWELPCRFDELTEDVPCNRLLRWACARLRSSVASSRLAFRLGEAESRFGAISPRPPTRGEAERLQPGPLHAALAPALRIGVLLLRGRSLDHADGVEALPGFLWEGETIFEAFALRTVQRAALRLGLRAEKRQLAMADSLGGGPELRTTPDIRVRGAAGDLTILDAKYKRNRGRPRAADVYQVVTAGKVTACDDVGLVYPLEAGDDGDELLWSLRGPGKPARLRAIGLDLTAMARRDGQRRLVEAVEGPLGRMLAAGGAQAAAASSGSGSPSSPPSAATAPVEISSS
ncbi:MAG TPA: hypothetical protein VHA54_11955 [Solirubrobacterales bacterium]|nr:hypothetical protein [Solirubrobacterales bacterium]